VFHQSHQTDKVRSRRMNAMSQSSRFLKKFAGLVLLIMTASALPAFALDGTGEPYDALVNNVFFDTYITDALQDVSLQTGVPILTDTTVSGFVTLDLVDVPLPDALRQLAIPGGYTVRWMDGYYLIGSARPESPLFHMLSV